MKIAIVILNWNGKALLKTFLPSVVKYSASADIYVADNASLDDSIAFVQATYPNVKVIKNSENGGYAKGYNDALANIEADVFCLLNNDVEVTAHWLKPIVHEFKANPTTAIIQPKLLNVNAKDTFEYAGAAGGFIDKFGYPFCRGRIFETLEKDEAQYDDTVDIFWASGACFFIRSSIFNNLGGFDTSFFAHMEEIDLCWRVINANLNIKYIGASTVFHLGGGTLQSNNPKKTYLNFRNSLFTLVKNAKGNVWFLVLVRLLLDGVAGVKFLVEFKPKHTFAIIKAHFSFYYNVHRLLTLRKATKRQKKYYYRTSIIWDYYVNGKKRFNSL